MDILSLLIINPPKDISLPKLSHALSLLHLQGPHLFLQHLHLLIEFCKSSLDITVPMDLHKEGLVADMHQHIVNAQHVLVVIAEGGKALVVDLGDIGDVEDWGSMDETL